MRVIKLAPLLLVLLVAGYVQSEYVVMATVDNFEVDTPLLTLNAAGNNLVTKTTFTDDPSILGGQRDLILRAESGDSSSTIGTQVSVGSWTASSSGVVSGYATLQYDGLEGSTGISQTGLDCYDLTVRSAANSFVLRLTASTPTDIKFFVYNNDGTGSSVRITANQTETPVTHFIRFDDFPGQFDFTCIGAIALTASIGSNAYFSIETFEVGRFYLNTTSHSVSPSNIPSPTRTPSTTRSPAQSPIIQGPTVSQTPTPTSSVVHAQCAVDSDCDSLVVNRCQSASCTDGRCHVFALPAENDCCSIPSDCFAQHVAPHDGCNFWSCESNICAHHSACTPSAAPATPSNTRTPNNNNNNNNNNSSSDESDGGVSGGAIFGIIVAVVAIIVVGAIIAVVVLVVIKKRAASNSTSVYDAMIGDM